MNEQAHNIINRYLAAELGQSVERPDEGEISRQRNAFIEHFGPEQLAKMSGQELMRQLPHNVLNEQPMDLWLDSKVDEKFNHRLFGSISDGSWAKFGPWQDKKTRSWRCKRPGSRGIINISEDEALKALEERRIFLVNRRLTLVPLFRERSLSTTIKVGFKVSKSSFTTSFIL